MEFEWDREKAEANLRKHGVDFADAVYVFLGPVTFGSSPREKRLDMSDGNITRVRLNPRKSASGKTDWRRVDALSDSTAMRAALADPDAKPTSLRNLKRFRRVVRVRDLRERLHMTQAQFASAFGFSVGAVRDWEQMRSRPDAGMRALLQVIAFDPDTVRRALEPQRKRSR